MRHWIGLLVVIVLVGGCQSPVNSPNKGPVKVKGVTVAPTSLSLVVAGSASTLTATVNPSDAENKGVSWTSSAPSVATVNSQGVVTPVAAGSATITVTTDDGSFQATASVTVTTAAVAYRTISGRLVYTQQAESNIVPHSVVVVDSNIQPYADVPIYLAETGATVTTDENGDFTFTSVDPAFSTYHLVVYGGEWSSASEYAVQTIVWQSTYGTSYSLEADWDEKDYSNRYRLQLVDGESNRVGGIRAKLYHNATDELIAEDWSDPSTGDISFWSDFWADDGEAETTTIYRLVFSGATAFQTVYLWRTSFGEGFRYYGTVNAEGAGIEGTLLESNGSSEVDFGYFGTDGPVSNEVMVE